MSLGSSRHPRQMERVRKGRQSVTSHLKKTVKLLNLTDGLSATNSLTLVQYFRPTSTPTTITTLAFTDTHTMTVGKPSFAPLCIFSKPFYPKTNPTHPWCGSTAMARGSFSSVVMSIFLFLPSPVATDMLLLPESVQ